MTFFCFFWHSHVQFAYYKVNSDGYHDTFIHFMNGVYDNLPPTATIIDGNETNGDHAADGKDFQAMANQVFHTYLVAVEEANIVKAKTQTHLAPAFYLDPYFIKSDSSWAKKLDWEGHPDRTLYFLENMKHAMKVTDKYIWTWGENGSWWRDKPDQPFSWESRSPGVTEGLRWVFAPGKYAENARARLTGNEPNLLKNAGFEDLTGYDATAAKPKVLHWAFWQSAQSRGTYGLDRGAGSAHGAFFANVLNAC